ncbi:MAG: hypothetical protein OHK0052_01270 [Anaerolineales bacterium]
MYSFAQQSSEAIAYRWQPIAPLPENWRVLRDPSLYALAEAWRDRREQLEKTQVLHDFNERWAREWAIETGILERLYTLDHGVTQLLIEQGIDSALIPHGATNIPVVQLVRVLKDHRNALDGLFDFVANRRKLSINYVCQLHQAITRSQETVEGLDQFGNLVELPSLRGQWKKFPNNPKRPDGKFHEYCPPIHVQSEVERLIAWFDEYETVSPEIKAAWLHHRFSQIHPFQDGNGRVARALASIVFLQAGWFPLSIQRDQRSHYITALEKADAGDLAPLTVLFATNAKKALSRALTLAQESIQEGTLLPKVLEAVAQTYQERKQESEQRFGRVESWAQIFANQALTILEKTAQQLQANFVATNSPPMFRAMLSSTENEFYYTREIVEVAKALDYWANVSRRRWWTRLHIFEPATQQKTHIVFSFHYLGKVNRGVMVCSAFLYLPEKRADDEDTPSSNEKAFSEVHRLCEQPFYFSYAASNDQSAELLESYRRWVDECLALGLAEWVQRS